VKVVWLEVLKVVEIGRAFRATGATVAEEAKALTAARRRENLMKLLVSEYALHQWFSSLHIGVVWFKIGGLIVDIAC